MFENALIESQKQKRSKGRLAMLPIALGLHAIVILMVVVGQLWAVDEVPEPAIQVSFWAAPPPPPPPPPPPRAAAPPKPVQVQPAAPVVQPKEIPQDIPKQATGGGVDGGVEGGIEGGEMGGVIGGIPGGVPGPTPVPTPDEDAPPIRVGGAVLPPVKVREVLPIYPEIARKARVQGVVILEATINREGSVVDVKVLRGLPMGCTEAAIEALQKTKFKPATMNGRPVAVYYVLTVTFKID